MNEMSENKVIDKNDMEKNPSRWWALYHFFGGTCLYLYIDMSGLSKFIARILAPGSLANYSIIVGMLSAGSLVLGYFLSQKLINSINNSLVRRKIKILLKALLPFGYFFVAMFLVYLTVSILDTSHEPQSTSKAQSSEIKPIKVFTTTQSADGVTENDLTHDALMSFEASLKNTWLEKSKNAYVADGNDPKTFNVNVEANSVYAAADGKKLAVIRMSMGDYARQVVVIGIVGADLVRVSCIRSGSEDIPVWYGECGDEVRKTFDISFELDYG